jgi:hypothetical protein
VGGEANIGKIAVEEKVLELSFAVNTGFEAGGILAPAVLFFK